LEKFKRWKLKSAPGRRRIEYLDGIETSNSSSEVKMALNECAQRECLVDMEKSEGVRQIGEDRKWRD
jgi:hypothetical protein